MTPGRLLLLSLLAALCLTGCAGVAQPDRPRYVWPPDAENARIEYLGFYASEANLQTELFTRVSEVVFGVEPAKPIFVAPFAVDAWRGRVLVTDSSTRVVYLLDIPARKLGVFQRESGDDKKASVPTGVAILDDREFLVVDTLGARVDRFSLAGSSLNSFGEGTLVRPVAVAVDRRNPLVAVIDPGAHRLAFYTTDGTFLRYFGERGIGPGQFNYPLDADFDSEGNLFVLDSMNFRVQRFDREGDDFRYAKEFGEIGTAEGAFTRPKGIAVSPSGHVYVTDALAHKVVIFDREGEFLLNFGRKFIASGGKFAPGGLYMPAGIAADEDDGIWVVDSLNRMVHHFQYLNEAYLRDHPLHPGAVAPTAAIPE